jgi:class 3 adenylate cyclase
MLHTARADDPRPDQTGSGWIDTLGLADSGSGPSAAPPSGVVTILFTDIVGSTELIQRLGDDSFEAVRRSHFAMLGDAVAAGGGMVVKTMGDGIMAVFPSGVDALGCAVAMQQAIARSNRRAGAAHFDIRVGMHTGEPSHDGNDYFGTPVVVARRLCDSAQGGDIYVSRLAAELVGARGGFEFSDLGPMVLKGLSAELPACRVAWSERGPVPLPPAVADRGDAAFVGRDPEIAVLDDALRRAQGGRLQVVLVAGEPGIGKTTLAVHHARRAWEEGGLVLFGRCDEESLVPFQPFVEALSHYVDHAGADELRRHVEAHAEDLSLFLPALARRLPGIRPSAGSAGELERYRMFEAIANVLAGIGEEMPVVILLDDLHWADRPTLQLLQYVARRCVDTPLLVLGTYRDTDVVRTHPLAEVLVDLRRSDGVTRIPLRGLSAQDVRAMVNPAGTPSPEDVALGDILWRETEGSPLFLREILRHLSETGAVSRAEDGRWQATRRLEQLGIPDGIRDVIARRLSRLSGDANSVLVAAAVVGREFDVELVGCLVELSIDAILDALDEATATGLVDEVGHRPGHYSFTHALVRQTLYGELSITRRVRWHQKVGEAIETLYVDDRDGRVAELAHHFTQSAVAGTADKAVAYCQAAGVADMASVAYEEAARHFAMGLEVAEEAGMAAGVRSQLLIARGQALWRSGDAAARPTFKEAAELARDAGDVAALAEAALGYAGMETRPVWVEIGIVDAGAITLLEEALAAIGPEDSSVRALVLSTLARELYWLPGTRRRREALCEEAVAIARQLDESTLAHVLINRCLALMGPATVEQRLRDTEEVLAIAARQSNDALTLGACGHMAMAAIESGDLRRAWGVWDTCTVIGERIQDPIVHELIHIAKGALVDLEGDFDKADELRTVGFGWGQQARDRNSVLVTLTSFSIALRRRGRSAEAVGQSRAILELYPLIDSATRVMIAILLVDAGEIEAARNLVEDIDLTSPEEPADDLVWLFMLAGMAEISAAVGDTELAESIVPQLEPHRGLFVTLGYTGLLGPVDGYLAAACSVTGRHQQAVAFARDGLASCERSGSPVLVAESALRLATVLAATGDPVDREEAARWCEQARATAERLDMPAVAASARALTEGRAASEAPPSEPAPHASRLERGKLRLTAGARNLVGKLTRDQDDDELLRRFSAPLAQRALVTGMAKSFQPGVSLGFQGELGLEVLAPVDGDSAAPSEWWTLEIRGRKATARQGRARAAAATVRTSLPDLVRLLTGELHPLRAVIEGRVHIDGDPVLAGRIPEMFGGVDLG